jgi:hypothetical protein
VIAVGVRDQDQVDVLPVVGGDPGLLRPADPVERGLEQRIDQQARAWRGDHGRGVPDEGDRHQARFGARHGQRLDGFGSGAEPLQRAGEVAQAEDPSPDAGRPLAVERVEAACALDRRQRGQRTGGAGHGRV